MKNLNDLCTPVGNYRKLREAMENHEHAIHPHPLLFRGVEAAGQNTNLSGKIEIFGKVLAPLKGRDFLPSAQNAPIDQRFEKSLKNTENFEDKDILLLQSEMKKLKDLK